MSTVKRCSPLRSGFAVGLACALFPFASAQSPNISIEQAVEKAMSNSPRIRALSLELKASSQGLATAKALSNPTIMIIPAFTRVGSDEELLITQPLEFNGSRSARTGVARAQLTGEQARAELELREFIYSIKSTYVSLAKAQERLSLATSLLDSTVVLESIAGRQVALGSRAGIEKTQMSVEVKRAKQQVALAEAEHKSAQMALNVIINQEITAPVVVKLDYKKIEIESESEAISLASSSRSEVAVSKARQDELRQESRLARASLRPDLVPQFRMDSFTRPPRGGGFGIGISWQILDHGRIRGQARQIDLLRSAEELRLKTLLEQIRVEVTQALTRLKAADEVLSSYDTGLLSDSKKLLDAARTGYTLGETTLASVLEAQRTFRSVQSDQIEALASYAQATAQLERAIGVVPRSLLERLTLSGDDQK